MEKVFLPAIIILLVMSTLFLSIDVYEEFQYPDYEVSVLASSKEIDLEYHSNYNAALKMSTSHVRRVKVVNFWCPSQKKRFSVRDQSALYDSVSVNDEYKLLVAVGKITGRDIIVDVKPLKK